MPHKPNPIPRFNAATNPPSQYNFPSQSPSVNPGAAPGPRREHTTVPPRHRASSWTSQSSQSHEGTAPTASASTGSRSGANSGSGGGSRSGRSLPPPRFQRKQRPPRVQQALAAANNSQHGPSPRSGGGGRRDNATGWNNPAMNIPSLSMATVNAASARGSMFQLQQPPCANPPPVDPRSLEIMGFDELGEDDYDDLALTEYEDLDPVQLHHQLSFGMSHPTNMSSTSTDSLPQFPHEPTLRQVMPPQDVFVPTYPPAPSQPARNDTRLRSFSHNTQGHPQHNTPSPGAAPSPYVNNFGMQTPLTVDITMLEGDSQSRMRSRSLMSPLESSGMHKSLQNRPFPDVPLPQMPTALGGYEGPPTSERARNGAVLPLVSGPSLDNTIRKPLKSALKVRATDTRAFDIFPGVSRSAIPPIYTAAPGPATDHEQARGPTSQNAGNLALLDPIPDSQFTLPDGLQSQYAHQLRLLQEEYASKAVKAGRTRQRSLGRGKPSPRGLNAVPSRSPGVAGGNPRGRDAGERGLVDDGYASWDDRWAEQECGQKPIYNHPGHSENLPASFNNYTTANMDHSGSEDGRSDIGDRGHEDPTMRVDPFVYSSTNNGERMNLASLDVSPVGAVAHGHESSSSVSSNALSNAGHDVQPISVEITAPTPLIVPTDLEELGDQTFAVIEPVPKQGSHDSSIKVAAAASSEESVSTESNSTFTRAISPTTVVHPPLTPFDSSSTVRLDHSEVYYEAGHSPAVVLPIGTNIVKPPLSGEAAPRPSLERLAQRISRGVSNPSPAQQAPSAHSPSFFTTQPPRNYVERFPNSAISPGPIASFDGDMDTMAHSLRATSIHSSSPRSAASAQASFGLSLGRINEQPGPDMSSPSDSFLSHNSLHNFDGGSFSSHGPRDRRSGSSMLSQNSQGPAYRSMRTFGISEGSSAASIESGSSHAFTSASGHSQSLLSKRVNVPSPIAQSAASSEGHHSSHSHTSAPLFPSPIQRPIHPEDKLKHQSSNQSIGSLGSGKNVSGTGSAKMSAGESIWAMGKDESSWPQAPPSSSGHSTHSKGPAPFTLGALIPSTLLSEMDEPTPQEIELSMSDNIPGLHNSMTPLTARTFASSPLTGDVPTFQPSFHPQPSSAPLNERQGRPKQFAGPPQQLHAAKSMPNIDANRAIPRGQASRLQQLRTEADAYGLPAPDLRHLPRQSSSSSLPLNHSNQSMDRWNPPPSASLSGMEPRAFGSVHSHFTDPGSRANTIILPASGGVFPRFQEISVPSFESAGRSGNNSGKFKSLFKPRDNRVFK